MADRQHYTATQVASALRECKGGLYLTAKRLGCSVQTVLNYCRRYATVQAAKDEERGVMIDEAELRLWAAIQDGHPWAITFCLRTIGRHRGYVERLEQSGPDGGAVVLRVVYGEGRPDRPGTAP